MPNDTSTLNGSLLEMKDQLIYELGQKGVSASYDSTTGLLGLIGKISEIQQGGSCYHIEFSEDSYTATGGAVTLECTLQQNYAPLPNVSVSLSDGSSVYSSITNSSGVATFSLTGLTTSATYTCTYQNVSDTCTVNLATYLFYDSGVTGSANSNYTKSNSNMTISVGDNGTTVSASANSDCFYYENVLLQGDFRAEFTIVNVVAFGGIAFLNSSKAMQWSLEYWLAEKIGLRWNEELLSNDTTMGKTIKIERIGTTLNTYLENTFIGTKTVTSADGYIGWKTHRDRSRRVTFKDFSIISL